MNSKRILLVLDDKLLLKLYQEKLESDGFVVFSTRELARAGQIFAEKKPDLVLMDVVFQKGSHLDFLKSIRSAEGQSHLPVLILPNASAQLANEATQAGASLAIVAGERPIESILRTLRSSLGLPPLAEDPKLQAYKPDEFWVEAIFANAIDSINRMRHCLPGIAAATPELSTLQEMWTLVHAFMQKTALLPYKPLTQLASALDLLLQDLNFAPSQLNPSTVRTVGQALDFLGTILNPDSLRKLGDPADASLLVVDDEEGAREVITSALQMAGLRNECAESPSAALDKLNRTTASLIFLDVGLPEMNGFELCAKVRTLDKYKSTPVVFITGMATFMNKAKASLSGGTDFVGKPFNIPELGLKALMWICHDQLQMA